ncbi:MAG TPA: hypothetical protein VMW08_17230, partial [Acidimicrobiales bacterium]|nr:hypothetical protein [Acidimicrobiales bacterium]
MAPAHVVVDGSNIATEGRSMPSLAQLDEAVRAFIKEYGEDLAVTVVVDATFGHRIDPSERKAFDEAIANNEMVTPPAGAIGRGDAFVLEIAERVDAAVLSNDSFQEFHGTIDWLFDEGRLIGGKPVPAVGWIFLPRSPVRGPASRRSVSEAKRGRSKASKKSSSGSQKSSNTRRRSKSTGAPSGGRSGGSQKAVPRKQTRKPVKKSGHEPEPYNEPLPFIEFVAAHPVGTTVEGEVERFSSHGCYLISDGARCYLSLKLMGDPAPTSPKEVVSLGETLTCVVISIDTPRRGIDLALPGFVPDSAEGAAHSTRSQRNESEEDSLSTRKAVKKKKAPAKRKAPAKKAPAKRKAPAKKAPAKRKAPAKKAPAKR